MNTEEKLQWYADAIKDARQWVRFYKKQEQYFLQAIHTTELRRLLKEREQFVRAEAARERETQS